MSDRSVSRWVTNQDDITVDVGCVIHHGEDEVVFGTGLFEVVEYDLHGFIALPEIAEMRVVEYRALRDAHGPGLRRGRFEGRPARFCTLHGRHGVCLRTVEGEVFVIGSEQPHHLVDAIAKGRARALPATGRDPAGRAVNA